MKTKRTVRNYSYKKGRKIVKVPTHKRTYNMQTKRAWNADSNRIAKHWPMDPPNYRKKKSFGGYPNTFFKIGEHKLLGEVVKDKESGSNVVIKNYYPKDKTFEVMDSDGFQSLVKRKDLDVPKVIKESKPKSVTRVQSVPLNSIPNTGDSLLPFSKVQEGGEFGKQGRRKKRARDAEWVDFDEIGKLKRYGDKRWSIFRRDRKSSDVTKELDKEFY